MKELVLVSLLLLIQSAPHHSPSWCHSLHTSYISHCHSTLLVHLLYLVLKCKWLHQWVCHMNKSWMMVWTVSMQ